MTSKPGDLTEQCIKTFQKRFRPMVQVLVNASERLDTVHAEHCALAG